MWLPESDLQVKPGLWSLVKTFYPRLTLFTKYLNTAYQTPYNHSHPLWDTFDFFHTYLTRPCAYVVSVLNLMSHNRLIDFSLFIVLSSGQPLQSSKHCWSFFIVSNIKPSASRVGSSTAHLCYLLKWQSLQLRLHRFILLFCSDIVKHNYQIRNW